MFSDYLEPISINSEYKAYQIGACISSYSGEEDLTNKKVALIIVPDGRASDKNKGSAQGPEQIRKELYSLSANSGNGYLIDMGNLIPGALFADTCSALKEVCKTLLKLKIIPLVLGGSRDLLMGMYEAMEGFSNNLDITHVSADLPLAENEILQRICSHTPNYLFNMNLLGFQGHYVPPRAFDLLDKMGFEHMRLGLLKSEIESAEPLIRNTNIFSFDIGAVKQADAPANYYSNPMGLEGDMACQLCLYAGVSDTTNAFGLFEMNPEFDYRNQTAKLCSQMIWYFMEGVKTRTNDHPNLHEEFIRYRCNLDNKYPDIVFHKSKRTNRWWMELPNPKSLNNMQKNVLIPCSYADYQDSAKGEVPERYLRALQKMH